MSNTCAAPRRHSAEKLGTYYVGLMAEKERREALGPATDPREWALSFSDRPIEFIGELMGQSWWSDDWAAWRSFVRAAWGQELTPDEGAIYSECTGRENSPTQRVREIWAPVGRRGGKSRCFAHLAVHLACCYDWSPHLVPGERGMILVLAESKDRAQQTLGYVKAAMRFSRLESLIERQLAEEIEVAGNVAIRITAASFKAVRSRTTIAAICDELAFWPTDLAVNPDREIINAMLPSMLTIPGSMLFGISSPYAKRGLLYERFSEYWGRDDPRVLVWRAPTLRMNPSADRAEIERAYVEDPASAAAEYGAEFRADVAAFVTREAVRAVIVEGRYEMAPAPGIKYAAFVDPSGGVSDSMTLAIAHAIGPIGVLDLLREVRPPFSPDAVAAEFASDCRRYGVSRVVGDHYGGEWPADRFRAYGMHYEVSEQNKSEIYQAWLPLINAGRLELLDNRDLLAQACALERRTTRMGRDTIDHPTMSHDDVVNVAAGALVRVCVGHLGQPIILSPQQLIAASRLPPRNRFASGRQRFARMR